MYFDGSKRNQGVGVGVLLVSPKGDRMRYMLQMNFPKAYNNEAEYEALLHGMRMAKAYGATRLMIYRDSNLVVQQTMKQCDAISNTMAAYRDMYNLLEGNFNGCKLCHFGRASNEEADTLANIESTHAPIPPGTFLEQIDQRSIKIKTSVDSAKSTPHSGAAPATDSVAQSVAAPTIDSVAPTSVDQLTTSEATLAEEEPEEVLLVEPTWTHPYLAYMLRQELPED
jgi:ribonuclease HI